MTEQFSYVENWFNKMADEANISLTESKILRANRVNLDDCEVITSDVRDIRGELETESCLYYKPTEKSKPVLSRVAVRVLVYRITDEGELQFLIHKRRGRNGIGFPGGGFDKQKDRNLIDTAKREVYEEVNIKLINVRDTGIAFWTPEAAWEKSWVEKHIPEDKHYKGYYNAILTGEYGGESDNDIPEEIGRYKWYPAETIEKNTFNKDIPFYKEAIRTLDIPIINDVDTENISEDDLDESIDLDEMAGNEHGEYDFMIPGLLSHCVESPEILTSILKRQEIKVSNKAEEHEYFKVEKINNQGIKEMVPEKFHCVCFSKFLLNHAKRRASKWGFGIVVNQKQVKKYYKLAHRKHYLSSTDLVISGIAESNLEHYFIAFDNYGTTWITKEIFDWLKPELEEYSNEMQMKYSDTIISKGANAGKNRASRYELVDNPKINKANLLNALLVDGEQITHYYRFLGQEMSTSFPLDKSKHVTEIKAYLVSETWFDEGELRVWVKDPRIKFLPITGIDVLGIVIPESLKDSLSLGDTPAFKYLKDYINDNNIQVYYHSGYSTEYLNYSPLLAQYADWDKKLNKKKYAENPEYKKMQDVEKRKLYNKRRKNLHASFKYHNNPEYKQKQLSAAKARYDAKKN